MNQIALIFNTAAKKYNIDSAAPHFDEPSFISYQPNFREIDNCVARFNHVQHIVLIGHGGSISTARAWYGFIENPTKQLHILDTVDPFAIAAIKRKIKNESTLICAISKSGQTITQLEMLREFTEYDWLVITEADSVLAQWAAVPAEYMRITVTHPAIGGRFSGGTEVGFIPAALCGAGVEDFYQGMQTMYAQFNQPNSAAHAAYTFSQLEKNGYTDVFVPIYGSQLYAAHHLITQLCHESFGKADIGQTYLVMSAPESQHHTNQRFFGGRKNMAGLCVMPSVTAQLTENPQTATAGNKKESERIAHIQLHDLPLDEVVATPLLTALRAEARGVWDEAENQNIPSIALEVNSTSAQSYGSYIAWWQLFAVYSAYARQVDPFNQPEVEASKRRSLEYRFQKK